MIKVVHIGYLYGEKNTGGAAIAATRLHKALLGAGIESHYVCVKKVEDGDNVHELPAGWKRKFFFFLTKVTRGFWKLTPYRKSIPLNIVPLFGLEKLLNRLKPDVIHAHWLNADVASFEQIGKLLYPIVFNLHDLCIINAIEPHPFEDRRFITGFNKWNSSWIERYIFTRKMRMVSRLKFSFVGPSWWACAKCRDSLVGKDHAATTISNLPPRELVESVKFFEGASDTKLKFNVVFGAYGGRGNRFKGFDDLVRALKLLPDNIKENIKLSIYGESRNNCYIEGVETNFLGEIGSLEEMVRVLTCADIFLFPSKAETQGMTKVEALLCGLPVVTFDRTACAEGICHKHNGWIATDGDTESYSKGITFYYKLWKEGGLQAIKNEIREKALIDYSEASIVGEILKIYHRLIMV